MDYQALFEAGTLTPQQLFEWMKVDRNTAAAALKQRPELQKGLMEVLSRNSTSPSAEQNQPQSAYSQMQQKSDDLYGAEEDDSFLEGVGKGLLDVPAGAARIGGAIADYGKAGFNELTGNEKGLQWEDTPDLKDVAGDVFQTGIAAVTGGAGPAVIKETGKKVVQNLAKGGLKNIPKNIAPTAGKIKNKIGNTATGKAAKVALGGPKRQLAAGLGVAGGLNALDNEAPEAEQDITNTAPQEPEKPLDKVDLDTPIAERGPNGEVVDPAANQNLDNPNGQMAMTPEGQAQAAMQAKANSMPGMVNRQGGSGSKMPSLAQGRVQAQANFMADDIIKAQKIQARKDASKAHREGVMADNWETSQIGRESGKAWDELDDDTRQDMQKRFMANMGSPYDSSEGAKQARVDKVMNEFGGNYVSPDGETGAPGQLTKEQFMDKTGMRTEGTGITQNADGSFNTLEFGDTFENSGGRDSAEDYLIGQDQQGPVQPESGRIPDGQGGYSQPDPLLDPNVSAQQNQQRPFNPVEGGASMMANLDNFGPGSGSSTPNNSGKGMYTDQFGQQSELGKGTVRMSANDQEYGDANFKNKEDALGYLNRGASLDEPAPETPETPAPETPAPEEGEEGFNWSNAAKGAGLIGGGLLLSRTNPGRKMIQKGFNMFGKKSYPPGRNKLFQDAAKRNAVSGTSNVSGGLGRPGSMQQMGYQGGTPQSVGRVVKVNPWSSARNVKPAPQPQANPWSSTGNMRPPTPTPQSVGRSAPPPPQANPWSSTGNMKPNYSGGTPQSVGGPAPTQNLSNPWASTGNMRPRAATPQDAGFKARVDAMSRKDLIKGVGSPRSADGRRVATTEELRRLYNAMNQQIF